MISGFCLVLAFTPFHIAPLLLVHTTLLLWASLIAKDLRRSFWVGFTVSFLMNSLGFFWMIYTIHVFGYLPYWISTLIFLIFCGFGALNFSVFSLFTTYFSRRYRIESLSATWRGFWLVVVVPAAFVVIEWLVPKLFPVYIGHSLYWLTLLTQISELTGALSLSFLAMSFAGAFVMLLYKNKRALPISWPFFSLPWILLVFTLGFGIARVAEKPPESKKLRVALIQANIGSLEKVESKKGYYPKVRYVIDKYKELTVAAIASGSKPDLVLWPETAMPIQLDRPSALATEIYNFSKEIGTSLLTGAYSSHPDHPSREYNAAFLLSPTLKLEAKKIGLLADSYTEIYRKNVLLAFGEYFPLGETFPAIYRWFPQVADFARGTEQNFFTLPNQIRLGVTICYEAILPDFFRKTVAPGVMGVVNLTNDSWFGPTTEPEHHAALSTFRSVESRIPQMRVTNTGISLFVDRLGRMSRSTGIWEQGFLVENIDLPLQPPPVTLYLRWGEWFVALCAAFVLATVLTFRRKMRAPLPH